MMRALRVFASQTVFLLTGSIETCFESKSRVGIRNATTLPVFGSSWKTRSDVLLGE